MKTVYLIECYDINSVTKNWSLTSTYRMNLREKNKIIKDAKNHGYKYNRKEKAYILEGERVGTIYSHGIIVTSYTI